MIAYVRRHLLSLLGLCISVLSIGWLIHQFDLAEVAAVLRDAALWPLALVPPLLVASFALRAQRWLQVVEHDTPIGWFSSFRAMMIGYFLNNVLPARAGDIARALELGRTERMSRSKVLATLIVERTGDLLAMLVLLSFVLLSYPALPEWMKQAGHAIGVLTLMAVLALVVAHCFGMRFLPHLQAVLARRCSASVVERVSSIMRSVLEGVAGGFRAAHLMRFSMLTGVLWILEVTLLVVIARSVGLDLALGNALFVLLAVTAGTMVPASPGFVGTYEFFGVAALKVVGVAGAPALACILLLHLVTLLGSTLLGSTCFVCRPRVEPAATAHSLDRP